MLIHVFNSTVVSGPETLVIPSLAKMPVPLAVIFLTETRKVAPKFTAADYARSFGLKVFEISVHSRYDRPAIFELANLLTFLNATIVHAHDVKASTYALMASRHSRSGTDWRLLSTHHGVRGRPGLKVKMYEWYYTHFVLPHFDRVLTVCTSDRNLLLKRGLSPENVVIHLNGVDRTLVAPEKRETLRCAIRADWNLPAEIFVIGIVGRLAPGKGLERTLRVAAKLKRRHPELAPWAFVFFGGGPLEKNLKALARKLNLDSQVFWMGFRSQIGHEFAGFDLVMSLSEAEGLPINLVEAGWAATPVFATQIDGNLDLIPLEEMGVLVDINEKNTRVADKLAKIITDSPKRHSMGTDFQNHVSKLFSGNRWIRDLTEIYRSVV